MMKDKQQVWRELDMVLNDVIGRTNLPGKAKSKYEEEEEDEEDEEDEEKVEEEEGDEE